MNLLFPEVCTLHNPRVVEIHARCRQNVLGRINFPSADHPDAQKSLSLVRIS